MKQHLLAKPENTDRKIGGLLASFNRKIRAYPPGMCPLTVQLSLAGQEDYLALQQEAGLPLADYDGQTVTRCTYTVTNYPGRTGDVQVNLYLCGDVIIGGDIMALGENGFQASLLYPAENT